MTFGDLLRLIEGFGSYPDNIRADLTAYAVRVFAIANLSR